MVHYLILFYVKQWRTGEREGVSEGVINNMNLDKMTLSSCVRKFCHTMTWRQSYKSNLIFKKTKSFFFLCVQLFLFQLTSAIYNIGYINTVL